MIAVLTCPALEPSCGTVGYPIFIARNVQQVIASLLPAVQQPTLHVLTLAQLPFLVPYCWVRDIRYLGYPMLLANICLWGSLLVIIWIVAHKLAADIEGHVGLPPGVEYARLGTGTLLFTAQAVVAFEGIALVLPIREAMAEPQHFRTLLLCCMTAGTFTLVATGASAYLAYGDATATWVTLNIDGPLAVYVRGAFSLAVLLTYPLQLFPAMQALEEKLGLSRVPSTEEDDGAHSRGRQLLLQCAARTCLVCAAFLFSLVAPYDNLVGLAGGLCAVPLAFIFPGWFHLRICKTRSLASTAVDVVLVGFGVVMAPIAVVVAIISWH